MVLCHQIAGISPTRLNYPPAKSKCKVFTLPVQRKQTPYASCPVARKRSISWYLYYTQDTKKYQLCFETFLLLKCLIIYLTIPSFHKNTLHSCHNSLHKRFLLDNRFVFRFYLDHCLRFHNILRI